MFYRIVMDVFDVAGVIVFVTQQVFPITVLPQGLFLFGFASRVRCGTQGIGVMFGEPGFDKPPTGSKISIVRRQCPNAMQVVGHNDEGINFERMRFAHGAECFSQNFNRCGGGKNGAALLGDYGEEVAAAEGECASILHGVVVGLRCANPACGCSPQSR